MEFNRVEYTGLKFEVDDNGVVTNDKQQLQQTMPNYGFNPQQPSDLSIQQQQEQQQHQQQSSSSSVVVNYQQHLSETTQQQPLLSQDNLYQSIDYTSSTNQIIPPQPSILQDNLVLPPSNNTPTALNTNEVEEDDLINNENINQVVNEHLTNIVNDSTHIISNIEESNNELVSNNEPIETKIDDVDDDDDEEDQPLAIRSQKTTNSTSTTRASRSRACRSKSKQRSKSKSKLKSNSLYVDDELEDDDKKPPQGIISNEGLLVLGTQSIFSIDIQAQRRKDLTKNSKKKTNKDSMTEICRFCLTHEIHVQKIRSVKNFKHSSLIKFVDIIPILTEIEIGPDQRATSKVLQYICNECLELFCQFYEFRLTCEQNDELLRNLYCKDNKSKKYTPKPKSRKLSTSTSSNKRGRPSYRDPDTEDDDAFEDPGYDEDSDPEFSVTPTSKKFGRGRSVSRNRASSSSRIRPASTSRKRNQFDDEDSDCSKKSTSSRKSVSKKSSSSKSAKKKRRLDSESDNDDVKSDGSNDMDMGPTAFDMTSTRRYSTNQKSKRSKTEKTTMKSEFEDTSDDSDEDLAPPMEYNNSDSDIDLATLSRNKNNVKNSYNEIKIDLKKSNVTNARNKKVKVENDSTNLTDIVEKNLGLLTRSDKVANSYFDIVLKSINNIENTIQNNKNKENVGIEIKTEIDDSLYNINTDNDEKPDISELIASNNELSDDNDIYDGNVSSTDDGNTTDDNKKKKKKRSRTRCRPIKNCEIAARNIKKEKQRRLKEMEKRKKLRAQKEKLMKRTRSRDLNKETNCETNLPIDFDGDLDNLKFEPDEFFDGDVKLGDSSDDDFLGFEEEVLDEDEWTCRHCKMKLRSHDLLLRHYTKNHGGYDWASLCFYCGYFNGHKKMIYLHIKDHFAPKKRETKICDVCSAEVMHLQQHQKAAHSGISFNCPYCGKTFTRKAELNIHIKAVHMKHQLEKRFVCTYCNKDFPFMKYLKRHLRVHSNDAHVPNPYKCDACHSTFNTKSLLNAHKIQCPQSELLNRDLLPNQTGTVPPPNAPPQTASDRDRDQDDLLLQNFNNQMTSDNQRSIETGNTSRPNRSRHHQQGPSPVVTIPRDIGGGGGAPVTREMVQLPNIARDLLTNTVREIQINSTNHHLPRELQIANNINISRDLQFAAAARELQLSNMQTQNNNNNGQNITRPQMYYY